MKSNLQWVKYTASCLAIILGILLFYCIYLIVNLKGDIKDYNQYFLNRSDSITILVQEELKNNSDLLVSIEKNKSLTEFNSSQLSNSFLNISKAYAELLQIESIVAKNHQGNMNNLSSKIAQDISLYFQQHQNQSYSDEIIKKIISVNDEWVIIFNNTNSKNQLTLKLSSSAKILSPNPTVKV
ncbi:hypothetical protein ACH6EH_05395 [Paenibacillus sp. JSM ZJ436]|uniref:hypothetical protein n=1 Tax=Paenibacillus sp. JSM ZJ436 TaxID=3376190 RepID=UPI00379315D2